MTENDARDELSEFVDDMNTADAAELFSQLA